MAKGKRETGMVESSRLPASIQCMTVLTGR